MNPNVVDVADVFDDFTVPSKFRQDPQLVQTAWNLARVAATQSGDAGCVTVRATTVENRVILREIFGDQLRGRLDHLQQQALRRRAK
ncbi:hypothetical protein J7E83_15840 [Arthrobacter sp. ISL-48]|uniref:hypothetical protein n=1 Tax=Arthrobacter sp. ISL-48 TaxID=2819110 RepID=UPI001BE7CBE1|nr:hypothetical protein [Arthrobacter sp. ISL-48]MBT2533565.1 hypothetical protein [Arthrobacter sp. ISL-48]